jgi:hypothetical protein
MLGVKELGGKMNGEWKSSELYENKSEAQTKKPI